MEDNKQFNSNVPVPRIVIDRQGKVLNANENMGEVFLYEGIVGADVFTLTRLRNSLIQWKTLSDRLSAEMTRNSRSWRFMRPAAKRN